MARSILITGGSGYFGSVLAGLALARGDAVRIFDLHPPGPELGEADFTAGDVREAINAARTDNKNSVLMRVKSGGSSRFVAVPLAKG